MSNRWVGLTLAIVFIMQPASLASARNAPAPMAEASPLPERLESVTPSGDHLCPPRVQLRYPELCPGFGPASELEELARMGLYPMKPLPTVDPIYYSPYLDSVFLRMTREGTPIYPSASAAWNGPAGSTSMSPRGFVFYAYTGTYVETATPEPPDDRPPVTAYRIASGYVRDSDVEKAVIAGRRGMEFSRTPDRPFGWVISGGSCSQTSPGSGSYSGKCYVLHQVVQVYGAEQVGDWMWYQIGPDEWLEQRMLSIVFPDGTPPEGVEDDRWIVVNLYEQNVTAYEAGELVYAAVASTGLRGTWTRPGLYQIQYKLDADTMTGGEVTPDGSNFYFLEYVPYVMYFDGARALHGTYWHNKFGTQASRGCVNLSKPDANWFYHFSSVGTWVYVWDPSGNTPTDPAMYGEGGA
jgi:hypothetical protein